MAGIYKEWRSVNRAGNLSDARCPCGYRSRLQCVRKIAAVDAPAKCQRARHARGGRIVKLSTYLLGAAIVWAGIFLASAVLLAGTPYFATMLPILSGGATRFVIVVPAAMRPRGPAAPPT